MATKQSSNTKFTTVPREYHPEYGYGRDSTYFAVDTALSSRENRRHVKRAIDLTRRFATRRAFNARMQAVKRG